MSFAGDVWKTLSEIDVSAKVEKKGRFNYLSWTWAWETLIKKYPETTYRFSENRIHGNDSVEVWVEVVVRDGEEELKRTMWLPVMDNKNASISNPDSRAVNDARMRCLVKCIAMFGLGHYIFAGEDLPVIEKSAEEIERERNKTISSAQKAIEGCKTIEQLKNVWNRIPSDMKPELEAKKDMAKTVIMESKI